jgi:hypothetical protein
VFLESDVANFRALYLKYLTGRWTMTVISIQSAGLVLYRSFWHHTSHRGKKATDRGLPSEAAAFHSSFRHLIAVQSFLRSCRPPPSRPKRYGAAVHSLLLLQFIHGWCFLCSRFPVSTMCLHLPAFCGTLGRGDGHVRCCCKSWMLPNCKQ